MGRILKFLPMVISLVSLYACNSGHLGGSSGGASADQRSTTVHVARGLETTSDQSSHDNLWDAPFIIQSVSAKEDSQTWTDSYLVLPHFHYVYSQYDSSTDILQLNTYAPKLRRDNFSGVLNANEAIVKVKPCYFSLPGNNLRVDKVGWLNFAITNKNRVFINSGSDDGDTSSWHSVVAPFANNSDIVLNSLACYVEPDSENAGHMHMHLIVVGGTKTTNGVKPYSATGFVQYSSLPKVPSFSWRITNIVPQSDIADLTLNDVAIGDVSDDPDRLMPEFFAVGQNGILMKLDASYKSSTPLYGIREKAGTENDDLNFNAVTFVPGKHFFMYAGSHYLSSTITGNNSVLGSPLIPVVKFLGASNHVIPELDDRTKYGVFGVTSIGCHLSLCVLAIRSATNDKLETFRATTVFLNFNDSGNTSSASNIHDFPLYTINSERPLNEFSPEIYVDQWSGALYLLTIDGSVSRIYRTFYGDTSGGFKVFVNSLPSYKKD